MDIEQLDRAQQRSRAVAKLGTPALNLRFSF
jgi:hypothetical protein